MVRGDPAQPAQHVRDVRAEYAAVSVAFVHDHVLQPAEEPVPPSVSREQHVVQHVRGGEQVGGVRPGPVPLREGGVPVQYRGSDAVDAEGPNSAQLVGGERPGRRDVERGAPLQHRGERGQQVAQ